MVYELNVIHCLSLEFLSDLGSSSLFCFFIAALYRAA